MTQTINSSIEKIVQLPPPDIIIVGSGLSGAVIARYAAEELNKKVLILERRPHIGGNMYDFIDDAGIRIQKYGPHVFHTSNPKLVEYLNKFSEWESFNLNVKISINNKIVPSTPNFETIDTFFPECADEVKKQLRILYPGKEHISFVELMECTNPLIRKLADFLYENDFKPYTEKQWSGFEKNLDKSVFARIPVHLNYSESYWTDTYQLLPRKGYTDFIAQLLNHPNITIQLNTNACDFIELNFLSKSILINGNKTDALLIWTGAVDELLNYKYGILPYRSLRFDYLTKIEDSYQDAAVIAYPLADRYTRITEYKKLPIQDVKGITTIAIEYPESYEGVNVNEPYYPIPSPDTEKLYQKYLSELCGFSNLILVGRLAEYKYYNMDQALERTLDVCSEINAYFNGIS